jgi:hypothetical protein
VSSGATYLALAYTVVLVLLLLYVGIIAMRLGRMRHDIAVLREAKDESEASPRQSEAA